jgi:hypothetical protein
MLFQLDESVWDSLSVFASSAYTANLKSKKGL